MKRRIIAVSCALVMLAVCAGCPGQTTQAEEQEAVFGTLSCSSAISGNSVGDSFCYSDAWLSGSPEAWCPRAPFCSTAES